MERHYDYEPLMALQQKLLPFQLLWSHLFTFFLLYEIRASLGLWLLWAPLVFSSLLTLMIISKPHTCSECNKEIEEKNGKT